MSDDFDIDDLEIDTDEVLAESFGIVDGDFHAVADNGATDICVIVYEANMEKVVRAYLERNPHWKD